MKDQDPLDQLLQAWQPDVPLPADLRSEVWSRISVAGARAEAVRPWLGWWTTLAASVAVAALGFLLGSGERTKSDDQQRLAYFQRINPLSHGP